MRYATETSAIQFLFSFTFRWITFLITFFQTPKKKPWTIYSLWFLQNFVETMTAGYFVGGGGGNLPPQDCCLPPLQIGSNNIFQKIIHPQDPTTGSHANIFPPLQNIPRKYPEEGMLLCICVPLHDRILLLKSRCSISGRKPWNIVRRFDQICFRIQNSSLEGPGATKVLRCHCNALCITCARYYKQVRSSKLTKAPAHVMKQLLK